MIVKYIILAAVVALMAGYVGALTALAAVDYAYETGGIR